jgi:predicted helicase
VDDLAETFKATDVKMLMAGFGRDTQQNDPMIHFYEDFLSEYDPKKRKERGVWYTPLPVVKFIVRAVDDILQTDFNLPKGLADTSKIKIKIKEQKLNKKGALEEYLVEKEVHKVQILDPATGTGTFLAETVSQIHDKFKKQTGKWQGYVEEHLISRLNGFEILMAPYTMAHIKLDWLLAQTGFEDTPNKRLRIYLTNSLEEHHPETGTLFAQFLAREANEANGIKRDAPVMVVMGNPPYSVSSQNKGVWIDNLMVDYKENLNEKNIQPLSDDYIKFIRLGQHFIEKNGEGILAYISNNGFLDGLIHRQMRKELLNTFDKIYILNLHGDSNKKETSPDGSIDENVFDIRQGVGINIFVKNGSKKQGELADVFYNDLFGERSEKYKFLQKSTLRNVKWQKLNFNDNYYFFVPKDFELKDEYEKGFKINKLFPVNSSGVKTHNDARLVSFLPFSENNQQYAYRPLDVRYINYDLKKVLRHRYGVMKHFLRGDNIGLNTSRLNRQISIGYFFITKYITDLHILDSAQDSVFTLPLYLYPDSGELFDGQNRRPNIDETIIAEISKRIKLAFIAEKTDSTRTFAPIDVLDYVYAVLHSPTYREKYKVFLKIDFPCVPYPESAGQFRKMVKFGERLRKLHLLEGVEPLDGLADYPIAGSNEVDKYHYLDGKVYINQTQYFAKVPEDVRKFYIGGYQPAQRWLKDRKGRKLEVGDIDHYQRMIYVLRETGKIMGKLGEVELW